MENIIAKTLEYLAVPSVVGHENVFIEYLLRDFEALGLNVFKHKGLIEVSGATPHSSIVCAHLDRHGLISLGDDEYVYAAQYIREIKYGENAQAAVTELQSIQSRFEGEPVYAYDSITGETLGEGVIYSCDTLQENGDALFRVRGLDAIEMNIPLAYACGAEYDGGYLKGQIDNAVSLGVVYELFKNGYQGTALLTTEEEIGKSWLHLSAWLELVELDSQSLLVLDTSPYTEPAPVDDGYVVFRNRDKSEIFNKALVDKLKERCETLNIPFHVKDEYLLAQGKTLSQLGSTELGRLVQGGEGRWSGATIQIPTTMYHTSRETTSEKAIEHFYRFLHDILTVNP